MSKKTIASLLIILSALLIACQPANDVSEEPAPPTESPEVEPVEPTETAPEPTAEPTSLPPTPTEDSKFPATSTPIPLENEPEDESRMDELHSNPKVASAINDLIGRMNISSDGVKVLSVENKTWSDSSLGCPEEGMMYMQMLVEGGMLIQLEVDGKVYNYHAGPEAEPFLCNTPSS